MKRPLAVLLAAVLAAGCKDGGPAGGDLVVSLSAASAPRAIVLRVVGPVTGAAAPSGLGFRVFAAPIAGDTSRVIIIANAGTSLVIGPVARITVPNTGRTYTATVTEVADANYQLVNPAFYTVSIAAP